MPPAPPDYTVRQATLADADVLVAHRAAMFADMGVAHDPALEERFRTWLVQMMPSGVYRAWLAQLADPGARPHSGDSRGDIIGGGGITIIPWPPGPQYTGGKLAFVYNVYTEPHYRGRGIGRTVMETIHGWCRENGISSIALNASEFGRPLYDALGYRLSPSPTMFLALK